MKSQSSSGLTEFSNIGGDDDESRQCRDASSRLCYGKFQQEFSEIAENQSSSWNFNENASHYRVWLNHCSRHLK